MYGGWVGVAFCCWCFCVCVSVCGYFGRIIQPHNHTHTCDESVRMIRITQNAHANNTRAHGHAHSHTRTHTIIIIIGARAYLMTFCACAHTHQTPERLVGAHAAALYAAALLPSHGSRMTGCEAGVGGVWWWCGGYIILDGCVWHIGELVMSSCARALCASTLYVEGVGWNGTRWLGGMGVVVVVDVWVRCALHARDWSYRFWSSEANAPADLVRWCGDGLV